MQLQSKYDFMCELTYYPRKVEPHPAGLIPQTKTFTLR